MLTKEDKTALINALKTIDVKRLEIDHQDPKIVKWFRFGGYSGLEIASEVVRLMPEKEPRKKKEVA